jgi:hypothetical protein
MHSSPLWLQGDKPSENPKHIPSPAQAHQEVFLTGPVQKRLECGTLYGIVVICIGKSHNFLYGSSCDNRSRNN